MIGATTMTHTYILKYTQEEKKLNNDLRKWLSSHVDTWDYYKDYTQHVRIVHVNLDQDQAQALKEASKTFRGASLEIFQAL